MSLRQELRAVRTLAGPAIAMQLGDMALGVVDTLMVARIGPHALAAATLGNVYEALALFSVAGILMGIDPLVSQAHGAGVGRRAGLALQHALVLGALLTPIVIALFGAAGDLFVALGQQPDVAARGGLYVWVQAPSVPFFFGFVALRHYLLGREILAPTLSVILLANLVNIFANWVLIFGNLGAPALGLIGAGISTGVVRIALFGGLGGWVLIAGLHRSAWPGWGRRAFAPRRLARVLALGLPISLQFVLEIGAFSAATLIAGWLGVVPLAAHALVLNMASVTFMISLGISLAAATRAGNLKGAGEGARVLRSANVAMSLGAGLMSIAGLVFALFPEALARLYTDDPGVVAVCVVLLPIAGAFQIFDGVQTVAGGVLRGLGKTRPAAWANFAAYWLIGLPVGYFLALHTAAGIGGLWWSLAGGLAIVAVVLGVQARREAARA